MLFGAGLCNVSIDLLGTADRIKVMMLNHNLNRSDESLPV